jgi:amino acid transporter
MADDGRQLAISALGRIEVLSQSVAHLGPCGAAIVIFPFLTQFVGASIPFIVLVCLGAIILTGSCAASLVRQIPSAGGYISYVGQGLGKRFGLFTAWTYCLYEPIVPTASILIAAGFLEQVFKQNLRIIIPWWATTIVLLAIVHVSTYMGIKQSTQLNVVLSLIESLILVLLSISIVVHVGRSGQSLIPFHVPSLGLQSLAIGFAFTVIMFSGFESAVSLAEETIDAEHAIPRTMLLALLIVGGIWILGGYAMIVGFGVSDARNVIHATENPFFSIAQEVWGAGWLLVVVALVNSSLAAAIAGQNAASRVLFSLGRASILPRWFGNIHPRHQTPYIALSAQTILSVALSVGLGLWLGPIDALNFIGVLLGIGTIIVYALGNISVIPIYRRVDRNKRRSVSHFWIPLAATSLLGIALFFIVWPLPPTPLSYAEMFVAFWLLVGGLLGTFLDGSYLSALESAAAMMSQNREIEVPTEAK